MVVDTSVVLAILFDEKHAAWASEQLDSNRGNLVMSTVSLAEALIRIREEYPDGAETLEADLMERHIAFIAPDIEQACVAAKARHQFPINLGDCFVHALAAARKLPIVTLDADFKKVDVQIISPA